MKSSVKEFFDKSIPFGFNYWVFLLAVSCFTVALGMAAYSYDSKHPTPLYREMVLGWPGPIIDIHIERPIPIPGGETNTV